MSNPFKIILSFVLLSCILLLTSCNASQSIQNINKSLSPDIPMLLEQAQKHTDLEDYEKAIAAYQEIIKADPDCYDAYIELANVFMLQHQKHEALNLLKQGVLSLGGSSDERSQPLLDAWWEALLFSNETKELLKEQIAKIAGDPFPPAFYLENYKYLGDGMYYIRVLGRTSKRRLGVACRYDSNREYCKRVCSLIQKTQP